MSLRESERGNQYYYNKDPKKWADQHGGEASIWTKETQMFMDLLPGGDIVEIGPGIGNEAMTFIASGQYNEYWGIDSAIKLLRIAKSRNPSGKFVNASVYDLSAINKRFDGFVGFASYLHVPKDRINEALQITRTSLYPAAYGVLSMKEGEGEKVDPETGRTFSYYDMGEFYNILRKNGFGIVRSYARNVNENLTWLNYYVQKR